MENGNLRAKAEGLAVSLKWAADNRARALSAGRGSPLNVDIGGVGMVNIGSPETRDGYADAIAELAALVSELARRLP